jgi:hypothetical protein
MIASRLSEVEEKYDLNAGAEGYGEEGDEDEVGGEEEDDSFTEDTSEEF